MCGGSAWIHDWVSVFTYLNNSWRRVQRRNIVVFGPMLRPVQINVDVLQHVIRVQVPEQLQCQLNMTTSSTCGLESALALAVASDDKYVLDLPG